MSWPLFAVIQLALTTVGVAVAFWLRNRELVSRLATQEAASAEAARLLEEAASRFESVADDALDKWLVERAMEFDDDDPVQVVQKLVLQNEREPIPDFSKSMRRRIAAGTDIEEQNREQWLQLRMDVYDYAATLIRKYPRSQPVVVQVYSAFAPLDAAYGVELPALPDATVDFDDDEESTGSEEVEHVRATNELLKQQLEDARNEVAALRLSGRNLEQQEADLKALLQQFTRDSRDMMTCIQELELENQRLRSELGSRPATDADELDEAARADDAA